MYVNYDRFCREENIADRLAALGAVKKEGGMKHLASSRPIHMSTDD
jgi:hypothetical protein